MEPALLKMGEVSVVFLLCRVGDSPTAESFFKKIEDNEKLKNMVYCSRERIDKRLEVFQRVKNDTEYFGGVSLDLSICLHFLSVIGIGAFTSIHANINVPDSVDPTLPHSVAKLY
jgi:hypothetical protein